MTLLVLVAGACGVVAVDACAKSVAVRRLEPGRHHHLFGPVGLRLVHNEGGSLLGLSRPAATTTWLGTVVFAVVAMTSSPVPVLGGVALALVVGGASGNLLDRWRGRPVVDFVAIGRWPVFNVADAALVVALLLAPVAMR